MDYADCGDLGKLIKSRQQSKSRLNEDDVKCKFQMHHHRENVTYP